MLRDMVCNIVIFSILRFLFLFVCLFVCYLSLQKLNEMKYRENNMIKVEKQPADIFWFNNIGWSSAVVRNNVGDCSSRLGSINSLHCIFVFLYL